MDGFGAFMTKINFVQLLTCKIPFLRKLARSFLYGDGLYLDKHHLTLIKTEKTPGFFCFYLRSEDLFVQLNFNVDYRENTWIASLLIMRGATIWAENTVVEDLRNSNHFEKLLLALLNNLHYARDRYPDLKKRYPPNLHRPELRRWD